MRKLILTAMITLIMFFFYIEVREFFVGEFMSTQKVCKIWGDKPLNVSLFKAASGKPDEEAIRSKMACSLLKNPEPYIGKDPLEIVALFGDPTGYYFNETMPAYTIGPQKKGGKDIWQIVFLIDMQTQISTVSLHQHCCDQLESWTPRVIAFVLENIASFFLWLGLPGR